MLDTSVEAQTTSEEKKYSETNINYPLPVSQFILSLLYLVPGDKIPRGILSSPHPPELFCPREQNIVATVSCPRGQDTVDAVSCHPSSVGFFVFAYDYFSVLLHVFSSFNRLENLFWGDFSMEDYIFFSL